jgi:tetrahydromethanopterin S-methyltransferase subunit H
MEMEVVKLSSIVMRLTPELYSFLTPAELECSVILKFGMNDLDANGALEIVQQSIFEQQKSAIIQ